MELKTNLTTKILIIGISVFLVLLLISGFLGLYTLKNSYMETAQYIEAVNLARESQVYFQNQFYLWNNIILQGEDFLKYQTEYHSFTRYADKVQDTLFNLKLLCNNFKEISDEISVLRLAHKKITTEYMIFIEKLVESNFRIKKQILALSKGKDEIAISEMDKLVVKIEDAAGREIKRINNYYYSLAFAALVLLSISVVLMGIYIAKKILTIHDELESRIKERTKEITKANADLKREILERVKTEERLRLSLKSAKQGIYDVNLQTGETHVNDELAIMLGYDPAIFVDSFSNFESRLHPDDRERTLQSYKAFNDGKQSENRIEFRQRTKEGKWKWILSLGKIVEYDTAGKPLRMLGTYTDITDFKKVEEKLAEEKELLTVTLRSIGDGVITTDLHGKITMMNKVAGNLTGWTSDEALGKDLAEVFHVINELTRKSCQNPVERVLSTGNIIELANHTLLIPRNGSEKVIMESGAPIKDKSGKIIGVVLIFRDITEKQAILENLQRADKLDSLGILAGGIAHDFNNLMNIVYGYIELAKDAGPNDVDYKEYLDTALQSFDRAKDLTHQLLTFAKGGLPVRKTGELKSIITEGTEFALSGANVYCEFDIAEDLWLCDFDENQLSQVINNLLINAKQAMPGGGKIKITAKNELIKEQNISDKNDGRFIKISIADTGAGIPADVIPKIFDPFFTTKKEGTGLGLATSYSIIQKHDGFIRVESVPGQGTTFHIFLPASLKKLLDSLSLIGSVHKGNGTIIIMDDKAYMLDIVGQMLREMGYTVIETSHGNETLDQYISSIKNNILVKAILLDLTNSGGLGGRETIMELRSIDADMPIFATSGYSEDPVMSQPMEYGFTDSISKPFRKSELAELLNLHLR